MTTTQPTTTPKRKHRITVRIKADKNGRLRAHYWGQARRWLPMSVAEAQLIIAEDPACDHDAN
jgi:hypothetical protein